MGIKFVSLYCFADFFKIVKFQVILLWDGLFALRRLVSLFL